MRKTRSNYLDKLQVKVKLKTLVNADVQKVALTMSREQKEVLRIPLANPTS